MDTVHGGKGIVPKKYVKSGFLRQWGMLLYSNLDHCNLDSLEQLYEKNSKEPKEALEWPNVKYLGVSIKREMHQCYLLVKQLGYWDAIQLVAFSLPSNNSNIENIWPFSEIIKNEDFFEITDSNASAISIVLTHLVNFAKLGWEEFCNVTSPAVRLSRDPNSFWLSSALVWYVDEKGVAHENPDSDDHVLAQLVHDAS